MCSVSQLLVISHLGNTRLNLHVLITGVANGRIIFGTVPHCALCFQIFVACHPGFLLNNNRLDKQLARIRLDYVSLNGFLFRHGLSHHNYCDSCYFSSDSTIIQSAAHHLFHCPLFVQERGVLFSAVNSALNRPDNFPVTSEDLLSPSGISRTDFRIAEAICAFTMSTMNGFM